MRPSPLDICSRLRLGQISRGSGLILLIHTSQPWYILHIDPATTHESIVNTTGGQILMECIILGSDESIHDNTEASFQDDIIAIKSTC